MKISYDHQVFASQAYGGISRYFCEIIGRIGASGGCQVTVLAPLHINELATSLKNELVGIRVPRIPMTGWIRRGVDKTLAKEILRHSPPDVLHETYYSADTVAPRRSRIVVTVHDMIHEKFLEMRSPQDPTPRLKAVAVARADRVICVSENTRKDLVDLLHVDPAKLSVIHHGCSMSGGNGDHGASRPSVARPPFLLYVGLRGGYKNFAGLLRAYASSARLLGDLEMLCLGGPPFSTSERSLIRQLGAEGKVIRVTGDDGLLRELYRSARCFVYPSFYEGFGMPVLEAMNCGCPVASSRGSCLPEIAGCAAEYFDPDHCESIRTALEAVVYSESRSHLLTELGQRQAAQYSWDRCARQTLAVYSSLC
jgi:glycosyltransferase involved in cell wall biosynthesis